MVREQVDAAALGLGAEARLEVAEEVRHRRAGRELLGQRQQPAQVGLARQLLLAEAGGRVGDPALLADGLGHRADRRAVLAAAQEPQRPLRGRAGG